MKEFVRQPLVLVVAGAVAVGLVVVAGLLVLHPRLPISDDIRKQVNFSLLYPDQSTGYRIESKQVTFNRQAKVLIFHAKNGDQDLTISEQATPDPFNDIPDYYPKLIEKLHGYADFDSLNGKVSLTRPEELKGAQSAVFNGKGTLMFVHPSQDLSTDDWRRFFNSLIITK